MRKVIFLFLVLASLQTEIEGKAVSAAKHVHSNGLKKFSVTKKNPNNFSYLDANKIDTKDVNLNDIKKFSYQNQNLINSLKTKLDKGTRERLKFSYAAAMRKYVPVVVSNKHIPTNNLKTSVAEMTKFQDLVKSQIRQPGKKMFHSEQIGGTGQQSSKVLSSNAINIDTGVVYVGPAHQINHSKGPATQRPTTQSSTTKATTEQQETEAPDSEQTVTGSPIRQKSRCFCMATCTFNLSLEGQCGKPNASGKRMSKCCTLRGNASTEVGEAEEFE